MAEAELAVKEDVVLVKEDVVLVKEDVVLVKEDVVLVKEDVVLGAKRRDRDVELGEIENGNGVALEGDNGNKRTRTAAETAGSVVLTEQEAAIYDRQLRVWGVEAQRRLSKARVLVAGVSGVTAETCKNIVLAGIGRLTLLDDRPVTVESAGANFLIEPEEVGEDSRSLAKLCAESLREYNPMVKVEVETGNVVDKPAEFFDSFETVVLDGASLSVKRHVNAVCRSREQNVAFYAVDCRDSFGSLFVDLQSCSYTSKKSIHVGSTTDIKTYPSLEDVLSVQMGSLPKRTSNLFFATRIVDEFEMQEKVHPGALSAAELPKLLEFAAAFLQAQGMSMSKPIEKLLHRFTKKESSTAAALAAIVGGILGQEITRALSCKGEPLKNYFFFDTADGKGIIENISPSEPMIIDGGLKTLAQSHTVEL